MSTVDNLADFFTKALQGRVFFAMRDQIMNIPRGPVHGGVLNGVPQSEDKRYRRKRGAG